MHPLAWILVAAAAVASWLALHVWGVFRAHPEGSPRWLVPVVALVAGPQAPVVEGGVQAHAQLPDQRIGARTAGGQRTGVLALYLLLGARPLNLVLSWGLPAILSAVQLFVVGTWLPHRHRAGHDPRHAFPDRHRARTLPLPWLASLLACFHFGLHREHHCRPHVPWWRLPAERL